MLSGFSCQPLPLKKMTHPRPFLSSWRPGRRRALARLVVSVSSGSLLQAAHAQEAARQPQWATRVGKSPNLFQVTPTLFRSAQLSKDDVAELKTLGIKNVIGLRAFHSDDDWLRKSGIKASRVKIYTWAVNDDNIVAALRAIRTAEKEGPVLLHCWHGADRTGLVSAMYRLLYQGWSRAQARDAVQNGGSGINAVWKNIPVYLRDVDVEKIRRLVDGH
jgi:protein tyrosine/serine phosphatase